MAARKKSPQQAPKAEEKKAKAAPFQFSATLEEDGKEQEVSFRFVVSHFKLNKKVIQVAELFDSAGNPKDESIEIFTHLVVINSGIIQKIG